MSRPNQFRIWLDADGQPYWLDDPANGGLELTARTLRRSGVGFPVHRRTSFNSLNPVFRIPDSTHQAFFYTPPAFAPEIGSAVTVWYTHSGNLGFNPPAWAMLREDVGNAGSFFFSRWTLADVKNPSKSRMPKEQLVAGSRLHQVQGFLGDGFDGLAIAFRIGWQNAWGTPREKGVLGVGGVRPKSDDLVDVAAGVIEGGSDFVATQAGNVVGAAGDVVTAVPKLLAHAATIAVVVVGFFLLSKSR